MRPAIAVMLYAATYAMHIDSYHSLFNSTVQARNSDVYMGSIQELAAGVTKGLNGTVFAYGSTGSGKTHTMVGE
jgi:hypothetical protein